MTEEDCDATVRYIEDRFKDFKAKYRLERLSLTVARQHWNPSHERLADLEEMYVSKTYTLEDFRL